MNQIKIHIITNLKDPEILKQLINICIKNKIVNKENFEYINKLVLKDISKYYDLLHICINYYGNNEEIKYELLQKYLFKFPKEESNAKKLFLFNNKKYKLLLEIFFLDKKILKESLPKIKNFFKINYPNDYKNIEELHNIESFLCMENSEGNIGIGLFSYMELLKKYCPNKYIMYMNNLMNN